jgi:hypothetical protein
LIVPITAFADWLDYINTAVSWFNGVNNALSWIDLSIADMAGFFADIADYIYSIFDDYLFVLKTWLMNIVYALDPIGDGIVDITEGIVGWTQIALEWFLGLLDDYLFAIKDWLINVYNAIELLKASFPIILEIAYDYFLGELDDFLFAIKDNIINVWNTLKAIAIVISAVGDYFDVATSNLFNSMFQAISSAINNTFEYLFKPEMSLSEFIYGYRTTIVNAFAFSLAISNFVNEFDLQSNNTCFSLPNLQFKNFTFNSPNLNSTCNVIRNDIRPFINTALLIALFFYLLNALYKLIRGDTLFANNMSTFSSTPFNIGGKR